MNQKTRDKSFLRTIFSQKGLLSQFLQISKKRPGQREMAKQILDAYDENQIALIEAGTGIRQKPRIPRSRCFLGSQSTKKKQSSPLILSLCKNS